MASILEEYGVSCFPPPQKRPLKLTKRKNARRQIPPSCIYCRIKTENERTADAGNGGRRRLRLGLTESTIRRQLRDAYIEIWKLSKKLQLPGPIVNLACMYYKGVHSGKRINGTRNAVVSACVYIACLHLGTPQTFRETWISTGMMSKQVHRAFRQVLRYNAVSSTTPTAVDFVPRFGETLNLPRHVIRTAAFTANMCMKTGILEGSSPVTITGVALYLASQACGVHQSTRTLAQAIGIKEWTLINTYNLIVGYARHLLPPEFSMGKARKFMTSAMIQAVGGNKNEEDVQDDA